MGEKVWWSSQSRLRFFSAEKSQRQELGTAGHITATDRSRENMSTQYSVSFLHLYSVHGPKHGRVLCTFRLLTSAKVIKTLLQACPQGQLDLDKALDSLSQGIPGSVMLTVSINHYTEISPVPQFCTEDSRNAVWDLREPVSLRKGQRNIKS